MSGSISKVGRGFFFVVIIWLGLLFLAACGEEARATPTFPSGQVTLAGPNPTVTPPFQPATNLTPTASPAAPGPDQPTATATPVPFTPVIKPTPAAPAEATLTSDDLGIGSWSDTDISWSPAGDIFALHVLREGSDGDFFYLVRPPDSVQSSFKLARSVSGTMNWSPDGRYLSYIERDSDGAAGPVKLVDTQRDVTRDRRLFAGPCTTASWLNNNKLVATCGLAVYALNPDPQAANDSPEVLFKLENGRFPGSNIDLSLIFNALPSPDGNTLAMFGLRKQKSSLPVGEIAFYNLNSKKLTLLDRNNRPVTMVDWTPDSKYLVLRNLTGDWAVAYTFDFYLADPEKLKITQNLTKTNDKCDPVLGSNPDCQGKNPSTMQGSRLVFSPDGERYFYVALRYVSRPNAALSNTERLYSQKLGGKAEQLAETAAGERILGLTWLPNGHYFYSVGLGSGSAKAVLDGKPVEVSRGGSASAPGTRVSPNPTKTAGGALAGFGLVLQAEPTATTGAATSPAPASPQAPATTPAPPTTAAATTPVPPATATALNPTVTATPGPRGTSLLGFDTATAQVRIPPTPAPVPTRAPEPSPTPAPKYPVAVAYFASPTGNWVAAVDRVAASDKSVQFQVRLVPFTLK